MRDDERPGESLVAALSEPRAYPHICDEVRLVETHISWVFLTGDYAYKVKKPVDLGFLNFSTLELRHEFCEEEVRCNRRFAPSLYETVVPVVVHESGVRVGGAGEVIEYAVRMRQFPDAAQLDRMLEADTLSVDDLVGFATELASIHAELPHVEATMPWGTAAAVKGPVDENFAQIAATDYQDRYAPRLEALSRWADARHAALAATFDARRADGFVRECHGDLHLANMVDLDGRITAFDCIEFNPGLRWIDVVSDIAFLVMDLLARDREDLAYGFLDAYLEASGDYPGLCTFDYYLLYRSMVRAKVAALRAPPEDVAVRRRFEGHLDLAESIAFGRGGRLILMCGLSGSGKSYVAERLVPLLGAVRVRSDVERKRLHGLTKEARSGSALDRGLYSAEATASAYARLAECAAAALAGRQTVIVDATFLDQTRRDEFLTLAEREGAPASILYCHAPVATLRERVAARVASGRDPSEAGLEVLERQLDGFAAPTEEAVVAVESDSRLDIEALAAELSRLS